MCHTRGAAVSWLNPKFSHQKRSFGRNLEAKIFVENFANSSIYRTEAIYSREPSAPASSA